MQLDGRKLPDQAELEADLCIVGCGPVGASLAAEFSGATSTVLVLESGFREPDHASQQLNRASIDGDDYAGLDVSRHRSVGGTTAIWNTPVAPAFGAKYVPLDRLDFSGAGNRPEWPLRFDELTPYYVRAQAVAALGRFSYDPRDWSLPDAPIPASHDCFEPGVYQFGPAGRFTRDLPELLESLPNVTLCAGVTATRLHWKGDGVVGLAARAASGASVRVHARRIVLAAGGVENARMLLVEAQAGRYRDESGWLGRGFMEHPRDYTLRITSRSRALFRRLEFFDAHRRQGTPICGRLALREAAVVEHDLPNASVSLLPSGRRLAPPHWRLEAMAWRRFGWSLAWPPGYGWSRLPSALRFLDGFQLLINLEERPRFDDRLMLDDSKDPHGVPRIRLTRRWGGDESVRLARLRERLVAACHSWGLGPLHVGRPATPDPNSHHHLGGTRMGSDPAGGVTDRYGAVYGAAGLYVAGGSLFPTGGYANPTLTAIALGLRLADRLKATT